MLQSQYNNGYRRAESGTRALFVPSKSIHGKFLRLRNTVSTFNNVKNLRMLKNVILQVIVKTANNDQY